MSSPPRSRITLFHRPRLRLALAALLVLAACAPRASGRKPPMNPATYFEIPVSDLDRAVRFYQAVFDLVLERRSIDGYAMALFPWHEHGPGISGALVKGDVYVPAKAGPVLYFASPDIDRTLQRAVAAGGKVLYPRKAVDAGIEVAEFEDSEGNRIGLQSSR